MYYKYLSISSEPSPGRRWENCKWSGNKGETSWGSRNLFCGCWNTDAWAAHPCPAILLSFLTFFFFKPLWFSVNFLLTSIRNLAPVLTSLRAIGWTGSWKIWNNWSSFHMDWMEIIQKALEEINTHILSFCLYFYPLWSFCIWFDGNLCL